jgi:hypothetical protein
VRVVRAERRRSRKRGGETQRPRRSLSGAAVKRCGVAFPRPRMNGSAASTRTRRPSCPAPGARRHRAQFCQAAGRLRQTSGLLHLRPAA